MLRKLGWSAILAAAVLTTRSAGAANSGKNNYANVSGTFFRLLVYQNPGVTWTFTTSNLSPIGSDTVMHVQAWDDPQAGYIAGNDDYAWPSLASQVVVPPTATTRPLLVLVRSYGSASAGTCDFTATPSSGSPDFHPGVSFGGEGFYVADLQQSAHVMTAQNMGAAGDTIMLTFSQNNPAHAIAYDDDDGTELMSWVHNNEACPSCYAYIANYSDVGVSNARLVWDDDADSTDYDGDTLGATLEGVLGTCPGPGLCPITNAPPADTDQDGLPDGAELVGVEVNYVPIKLSTWGADPLQKDVFLEMDWKVCDHPTDPNLCPHGLDSGKTGADWVADADFKANYVDPLKADLAPGGFRIHLDIGRANSDSNTWYDWGDFGGYANQIPSAGIGDGFAGSTPERAYLFHHAVSFGPESGWIGLTNFIPGPVLTTSVDQPRTVAHELGHGFGLWHGGRPVGIDANYKPHYRSFMNYFYNYNFDPSIGFSHGNAPVVTINPTAAYEWSGLGTGFAPALLTGLRDSWCPVAAYSSGKCVNINGNAGAGIPIGAVDWDRDGTYTQGTNVQAAITVWDRGLDASKFASDANFLKEGALTWVNVGGSVANQLWIIGRDGADQLAWARVSKTTLDAGCGTFASFFEGDTDCAGLGGATTLVPGPIALRVAPGAAEYNSQILLVYQKGSFISPNGTVSSRLVTINSSNGNVTYGSEVTLPGGYVADQDVTALSTGAGQVTAYAPVTVNGARKLMQWTYNGSWSAGAIQQWSDATDINPMYGIGATRGYQDGSSTASTYAAIPTNPSGLIEFARKSNTSPFRWSKVTFGCQAGSFGCSAGTASSWAGIGGAGSPPNGTQPVGYGRPGLAYQKRAGQANSIGRFYMAINQGQSCSGPFGSPSGNPPFCNSKLIMTEGNVATGTPSSRRLTWITPAFDITGPPGWPAGASLVDDLTRDKNLRLFFTSPAGCDGVGGKVCTYFMPLADGIMNATMQDFNDYPYVQGGLRAALCLEGGTWGDWGDPCRLPPNLP